MILVDAHVHVHAVADAGSLLDAAADNFALAAQRLNAGVWQGVLLLAEITGVDWFQAVSATPEVNHAGGWTFTRSASEQVTLCAANAGRRLVIVAGRQIVTAEGIEVLALGTCAQIGDGQRLEDALAAARNAQAIVVLPWGVGKWLGARGRRVTAALQRARELQIFAGDNAGRPFFWPPPRAFHIAETQGRSVLPGSDPLPLPNEERYVGRSGFCLAGQLPADAPWHALSEMLLHAESRQLKPFGTRETFGRFFRNQIALRINKK